MSIANPTFEDDVVMVSFNVVSLLTSIPVNKACECIRKKLENDDSLHDRSTLDVENIIFLFTLVLSNNYFIYNNTTYKQIHGCAIGSLVVAIIAYIIMEEIEVQAIKQALKQPKYWKRYISSLILQESAFNAYYLAPTPHF